MGRRHKKRTHVDEEATGREPKTFVIKRGRLGQAVAALTDDVREVMLPFTAPNLRERKANTLKDFVSVSGQHGITHFLTISNTDVATYLKAMAVPQGPTITFRVLNYSLTKDVKNLQRNPINNPVHFKSPPLVTHIRRYGVVLDDESKKHLMLCRTLFKDMFPSMKMHEVDLDHCRRVVLMVYNKDSDTILFRHYVVDTSPIGLNKGVKRLLQRRVKDLSNYTDISDYILQNTGASVSDAEDDGSSHISVDKQRGKKSGGKTSVRLQEIGPRMTLQLIKVEEGLGGGAVRYHKFIERTEEEIEELQKRKEKEALLKEQRQKQQEARVKAKAEEKAMRKTKAQAAQKEAQNEAKKVDQMEVEDDDFEYGVGYESGEEAEESSNEENENLEWYKKELGEEPDEETREALINATAPSRTQKPKGYKSKKRKRPSEDPKKEEKKESNRKREKREAKRAAKRRKKY